MVINTCPLVAVSRKEDTVSSPMAQAKHITPSSGRFYTIIDNFFPPGKHPKQKHKAEAI